MKIIQLLSCFLGGLLPIGLLAQQVQFEDQVLQVRNALKKNNFELAIIHALQAKYVADSAHLEKATALFTESLKRYEQYACKTQKDRDQANQRLSQLTDAKTRAKVLAYTSQLAKEAYEEKNTNKARWARFLSNYENPYTVEVYNDLLAEVKKTTFTSPLNPKPRTWKKYEGWTNYDAFFLPYTDNRLVSTHFDQAREWNIFRETEEALALGREAKKIKAVCIAICQNAYRYILMAEDSGQAVFYNAKSGNIDRIKLPGERPIGWVGFLSEKIALLAHFGETIEFGMYRMDSLERLKFHKLIRYEEPGYYQSTAVTTTDGKYFAFSTYKGVIVYDQQGEMVLDLKIPNVTALCFSPHKYNLVLAQQNGKIYHYDLQGKLIHTLHSPHTTTIQSLAFSTDGRYLLSTQHDRTYLWYDALKDKINYPIRKWNTYNTLKTGFSPTSKYIFFLNVDKILVEMLKELELKEDEPSLKWELSTKLASSITKAEDCFCSTKEDELIACAKFFMDKNNFGCYYCPENQLHLAEALAFADKAARLYPLGKGGELAVSANFELKHIENYYRGIDDVPPPMLDNMGYEPPPPSIKTWSEKIAELKSYLPTAQYPESLKWSIANAHHQLAWHQILAKDFTGALKSVQTGFDFDAKTYAEGIPKLALVHLLLNHWGEANALYKKWRYQFWKTGKSTDPLKYYYLQEAFIHDIKSLEQNNIQHPDFAKVKKLLGVLD